MKYCALFQVNMSLCIHRFMHSLLTTLWQQGALSAIRARILVAFHAPPVAFFVTHIMASVVVPPYTSPRAVFTVKVFSTAKFESDPYMGPEVPDILVEGHCIGGGVIHGVCLDGNQESCH